MPPSGEDAALADQGLGGAPERPGYLVVVDDGGECVVGIDVQRPASRTDESPTEFFDLGEQPGSERVVEHRQIELDGRLIRSAARPPPARRGQPAPHGATAPERSRVPRTGSLARPARRSWS